jgi:Holliday junction resolvasome RuvABC endonuclease subunit
MANGAVTSRRMRHCGTAMKALALDPGGLCGWATGELGELPRWGTHRTPRNVSTGEALSLFAGWLRDLLVAERPDVCCFESPYIPMHGAEIPRNAATVRRLHSYSGIVEAVCWRLKIKVYEARPSEICRHFTGQGSWGGRDKKKAATVRTCLSYGWDVEGQVDAADALSLWAYAEAVLDPVLAAQRRAGLGLELALHPEKKGTPRCRVAGRRGVVSHKPKGNKARDTKSNTSATGEFQFTA